MDSCPETLWKAVKPNMDSFDEVFAAVKEYCKEHVVIATYNLFINDIEPVSFDGNKAVLSVRSEFVKNTLENRYLSLLQEAFRELLGFEVEIEFTLPQKAPSPAPGAAQAAAAAGGNYAFTFENFIVGSTNKFAHAAAQAVAANPSGAYNPLFIWGGSGLGKTHLLHAIKSEVEKNHPDFNIVYVDGEKFTNEIISAIHDNTTTQFHNKYRAADVLLVDDIQFIGGKESTQEEFFHTFNALHSAKKQIIISSDKPPKDMEILEDRLRSRFEWGLIVDISSPDYETRMAILRKKEELDGYQIDDAVIEYIAKNIKSNIRELEGALNKIMAYANLEKSEINLPLAEKVLKDIISPNQKRIVTPELIIDIVAEHFDLSPADLTGNKRNSKVVFPRQIVMYLCRHMTEVTLKNIGKVLGGRDHTTIMNGINKIEAELETSESTKEIIDILQKKINPSK